jgi:transcriptional regulator with XRE-family HTH domain
MRNPSRLQAWRLGHGLTLQDVGALTGRSVSGVSRIERGSRRLRPLQRVEFAKRLGVPVGELFDLPSGGG